MGIRTAATTVALKKKHIRSIGATSKSTRRWDGLEAPSPLVIKESTRIFQHEAKFLWSANQLAVVGKESLPEIAFLGCSNVGKSTLLNLLLGRTSHKLVRTSSKPGSTQELKSFAVGTTLHCVDTPGYGYKSRQEWGVLVSQYLKRRSTLRRTCLLIESSRGISANDEQLIDKLAESGISFQIVLTKIDKLKDEAEVETLLDKTQELLKVTGRGAIWPEIIGVSNKIANSGLADLRASLFVAVGASLPKTTATRNQKVIVPLSG